jgi:hypothetical protein
MKALCVVPFGMEEGTEAEIRQKEFGLVVGEPAVFHLLASTVRKQDQIGEIVEDWQGEIEEVTTMEAVLVASEGEEKGKVVPIWLQSRMTEIGTLELGACRMRSGGNLKFSLRSGEEREHPCGDARYVIGDRPRYDQLAGLRGPKTFPRHVASEIPQLIGPEIRNSPVIFFSLFRAHEPPGGLLGPDRD